jgi:hypothetical protein
MRFLLGAYEQSGQGLQAWPLSAAWHTLRQVGTGANPAAGAGQAMQLVFDNMWFDDGQFHDLMQQRLEILPLEHLAATAACGRLEKEGFIRRQAWSSV